MSGPRPDPRDFGMDGANHQADWRDSGYDHNTVYDTDGNRFSWDEAEDQDGLNIVNPHDNPGR